ncbi:MAG TPA: CDP-2,3-bis-(O-geranylgeranyl)-sn-glycerol synthase [Thermoplasmata archaeon]|jgi:CDP-2,3-bis-(O-geranylgeranyl)-sn-glycerol synthase
MGPFETILAVLWVMLPALVPNSAAVLLGGGTPMDFGRSWRGKRILGDGKTWRGFFGGALSGAVVGFLQIGLAELLGTHGSWGFGPLPMSVAAVFSLSFGSMLGDSVGSFLKRRIGKERGAKTPILDQYNFVAGAFALILIVDSEWFLERFAEGNGWMALVAFLILVPLIHRGVNIIGYKMGKKHVPW